jgi:CIC family chloride channel protein
LYPVVDSARQVCGVVTRKQLRELMESDKGGTLADVLREPVLAHPDEPLRGVVMRMAETGLTRMPVVESESGELVGMVSLRDLLLARVRNLSEERHRERVLELRLPFRSRVKAEG